MLRLFVLSAVLLAACTPLGVSPATASPATGPSCSPTIVHGRPPDAVVEFLRGGASPRPSYEQFVAGLAQANWAGNDAFWVSLPGDGVIRPTFPPERDAGWKFWSYAVAPGDPKAPYYSAYEVTASARRLDGPTAPGFVAQFDGRKATGYGPGFLAAGLVFPSPGCWEVTYQAGSGAAGSRRFGFVVEVTRP